AAAQVDGAEAAQRARHERAIAFGFGELDGTAGQGERFVVADETAEELRALERGRGAQGPRQGVVLVLERGRDQIPRVAELALTPEDRRALELEHPPANRREFD